MNIIFLTIVSIENFNESNIYVDLYNKFVEEGNNVYLVMPSEKRNSKETNEFFVDGINVLEVKIGNIRSVGLIEKAISTITLQWKFEKAIKKYFKNIDFDLVVYTTPPITFSRVVNYIKKKCNAKSYLLLKDIFPQNAVDINIIKKNGIIHRYFRHVEKSLYNNSNYIGCMSEANIDFVLKNNKFIESNKVELCPNALKKRKIENVNLEQIKKKYGLPKNKTILVYGGNLGKPQGINFLARCLNENKMKLDRHFIICGKGTEYEYLKESIEKNHVKNVTLMNLLPKEEFDKLVMASDIGLIFLDYRFTIPNFPQRLLCYMEHSKPVLAATDINTDIKDVIKKGDFGWWCESTDEKKFTRIIDDVIKKNDFSIKGKNGNEYFLQNYTVDTAFSKINNHFEKDVHIESELKSKESVIV